ncbi:MULTISPECIES: hypothetical protein [Methylobacterium]|uniref:PRC-barrel domain-containing protein n=2 Tax=Methylobacterium TaxID=407 RepID=A0A1Y0ZC56_9HYPH|nr:hypothetical protein [Methylobacterium aquaticum]QRE77228.1 hypothetical protein F1D61_30115 [Methylobacterium aquaticum]BAR47162.1 hypothetical protein Maq22A_c28280 [Methylobacterium aquaticum]
MRPYPLMILLALAVPAAAVALPVDLPALAAKAARRFPQPIRAGDLVGRRLLEPEERQAVLGRVRGAVRRADGGVDLTVETGWFSGRAVLVPTEAVGLLGEHVALLDLTPEQLQTLPEAGPAAAIPPDETIRVGLVKPFH